MKKGIRAICLVLAICLLVAIPVNAESNSAARASNFFSAYATDLQKTARETFKIWFDVTGTGIMDELGVSEIAVYSSSDRQTWTKTRTFIMEDWPEMVCADTAFHTGYITYNYATVGLYYRARITFYAKNSTGMGKNDIYTVILKM